MFGNQQNDSQIAAAIRDAFTTSNAGITPRGATLIDVLYDIGRSLNRVAIAIERLQPPPDDAYRT